MRSVKFFLLAVAVSVLAASCGTNGANQGSSTPIDSTNVKGSAPATYGGNNPANDERDSNRTNANDTGTKANNIHNEGSR